jgi:hypothetical protein
MTATVVDRCQICSHPGLHSIIFLGYVPPLNRRYSLNERPKEETVFPAEALYCTKCHLVQLGIVLSRDLLFPYNYPYVSGTTRVQREDFVDLYQECRKLIPLGPGDLVVDVGSNNGTLLANFEAGGYRVLGIEPTGTADLALQRGIPTVAAFLDLEIARQLRSVHRPARVVTATNLLAHVENVHELLESILLLLEGQGILVVEVQDLLSVVDKLQYDSFYHEHIRHYSLESLSRALMMHGLQVFHAKRLPTHGGSLRVFAARPGIFEVRDSVALLLAQDAAALNFEKLKEFSRRALMAKLQLQAMLFDIKRSGKRIFAVGAASRASMLVNYLALDNGILDCVVEIPGSNKIGSYMPGTLIPILEEDRLTHEQPEYALLLSWHVADELIPKLAQKGFKGDYIVPLPEPAIIASRACVPNTQAPVLQ